MKKIIVDKTEGIAEVIDRILNEPDSDITLVIPKGSALGKSVSNFHLLKREADSAGRTVTIESVDDTILAFARQSNLESSHPLWRGVRGSGGVSDIVPRQDVREEASADAEDEDDREGEEEKRSNSKKGQKKIVQEDEETEEEEEGERREDETLAAVNTRRPWEEPEEEERSNKKVYGWIFAIIVIAAIAFYAVTALFDHATIVIDFQQTPWTYQNNFVADASSSATGINGTTNVIPAQIFTTSKNVTQLFPASAVQNVSLKAQGMITIYNDYSAKPQELVATTRFLTPNGQIFRITNNVTVPGATMTNGTIAPSSITAPIVADQPGPAYNIGPVAKLTIPGFQNDPGREAGFYGAITASTTGGFTGTKAVPTASDIASAKASTTALLEAALQGGFSGSYPNNFKILDGATSVAVTKVVVNTSTDSNGNFSVFGVATLQAIGFDESALKTYLLSLAQTQEQNSVFSTINLNYSSVAANFTQGEVSFSLSVQATLEPQFSASQFQSTIAGTSISSARAAIAGLPQLSNGTISVWPFWLWDIPTNPNKVHITTQ
jgi:hypothetical protein